MPLGAFEREILRFLAANRNPDSFVAGATILNRAPDSPRRSQDIDLFHDTAESVATAVTRDRAVLEAHGYELQIVNAQPTFQRAIVTRGAATTKIEWVFDSAFRFFPIEPDAELGYVLNFWDAATNKLLAIAGRSEVRDYVDILQLDAHHLSLGALAWAASGKDGGFTPQFVIEEAQRNARFPTSDFLKLDLIQPLDPVELKRQWLASVRRALEWFPRLPSEDVGCLYLDAHNRPVTPDPESPEFPRIHRHFGSVRGAWPVIRE
jgi:hypothetical protein